MLIPCPHCGTRPVEEFTFLGDASVERPTSNDPSSMEQWYDYVYLRDNPRGAFDEYVHHSGGCRAWLVISRNTETHEVYGCMTTRDYAASKGGAA
ncbi:sarcosine oxidase subunit delta [Aestuariivirga sp.]|uniref:sarcosine oxidase subunit delta n=1 Tax=Aestuariivirga sp. TaxID=2650926 RepID=UPI003593E233